MSSDELKVGNDKMNILALNLRGSNFVVEKGRACTQTQKETALKCCFHITVTHLYLMVFTSIKKYKQSRTIAHHQLITYSGLSSS